MFHWPALLISVQQPLAMLQDLWAPWQRMSILFTGDFYTAWVCWFGLLRLFLKVSECFLRSQLMYWPVIHLSTNCLKFLNFQFTLCDSLLNFKFSSTPVQRILITNWKWNWKEKKRQDKKILNTVPSNHSRKIQFLAKIFCIFEYLLFLALEISLYLVENCSEQFSVQKEKWFEPLSYGVWFPVWMGSVEVHNIVMCCNCEAWHKWSTVFVMRSAFPTVYFIIAFEISILYTKANMKIHKLI